MKYELLRRADFFEQYVHTKSSPVKLEAVNA